MDQSQKEKLEVFAKQERRSLNKTILFIIDKFFEGENGNNLQDDEFQERVIQIFKTKLESHSKKGDQS